MCRRSCLSGAHHGVIGSDWCQVWLIPPRLTPHVSRAAAIAARSACGGGGVSLRRTPALLAPPAALTHTTHSHHTPGVALAVTADTLLSCVRTAVGSRVPGLRGGRRRGNISGSLRFHATSATNAKSMSAAPRRTSR